jgi:hypothetical protein
MRIFSCVSLSHLLEFCPSPTVSLQSCTNTLPLPPNYLHQPYWLAPRYWELITARTLPYINSLLGQPAMFLDSWHYSRPIGHTEKSVRNCHYSLRNNPEERSSHPPEEVRENRSVYTYSSGGWRTLLLESVNGEVGIPVQSVILRGCVIIREAFTFPFTFLSVEHAYWRREEQKRVHGLSRFVAFQVEVW